MNICGSVGRDIIILQNCADTFVDLSQEDNVIDSVRHYKSDPNDDSPITVYFGAKNTAGADTYYYQGDYPCTNPYNRPAKHVAR